MLSSLPTMLSPLSFYFLPLVIDEKHLTPSSTAQATSIQMILLDSPFPISLVETVCIPGHRMPRLAVPDGTTAEVLSFILLQQTKYSPS